MTLAEYYGLPEGTNMTLAYSSFYDTVDSDFPCPENMSYAFYRQNRYALKKLNVSNVTNMTYMFSGCNNLRTIEGIEDWDTSKVVDMSYMFDSCNVLETLDFSNWDVSKVTQMTSMFGNCSKIKTLDLSNWDTSKVVGMMNMFAGCSELVSIGSLRADNLEMSSYGGIFSYSELPKLTDFGGLINLKTSLTSDYNFKKTPNLSYESCINILNGLYDFAGNGETPNSSQGKLKVHQNFLNLVGDEISIGTNKGWTITA